MVLPFILILTKSTMDKMNEYGKSSSTSTSTGPTNEELIKAEKLRRRQEKIAQWKLKKEQEEKKNQNPETKTPSPTIEEKNEDNVKLLRQKKIEEWKKRKQLEGKIEKEQVPVKAGIKIKAFISKKNSPVGIKKQSKRPSIFGDDDEGPTRKKVMKFGLLDQEIKSEAEQNTKKIGDDKEEDALDIYLKELEERELQENLFAIPTISKLDEGSDPEGGDDEADVDKDDVNQLISSRMEKLQQREKILATIDHDKISYKPFRKQFYKESSELSNLSPEEVDTIRLLLDGIKVRGVDCPKPIQKWSQLGLPTSIMEVISDKLQYEEPSTIQCQALPAIMSGRDVIGVAKTGSGKTLSFVLPMIRHIQGQLPEDRENDNPNDGTLNGPVGLIMTPTRELSLQIYKEITNFSKKLNLRVSCCYGGSPIQSQIADLKRGVDIVVGTPGRIIDLLAANGGRVTNLSRVTYLVLDEADRMFDMGFEPQVMKVFGQVRPDRQTVLFSATFPRKMELLAKRLLDSPVEVIVGGRSVVAPEITQKVELFEESEEEEFTGKLQRLLAILQKYTADESASKILIFVEKQTSADDLLVKLLKNGFPCLAIHGGKDQMDRKHSIKEFAFGAVNILIATSIAARGLDVKGLNLVINYDSPSHMEDYVHRVGRTGRAGMHGTAITFIFANQERPIADLVKAMRLSQIPDTEIPSRLIEISNKFMEKVKSGKEKFSFGFGGHGLDKLQEVRDSKQNLERKSYGEEGTKKSTPPVAFATMGTGSATGDLGNSIDFPDFEIIEGRAPETAGPDKGKFHARIAVNDLPQSARWILVSRENISKVIESTGTSITNKGQYYPPNTKLPKPTMKNGKEVLPPPKLYLLVEGLTEAAVQNAILLLRQKMVDGLEVAVKEDGKSGPSARYTV